MRSKGAKRESTNIFKPIAWQFGERCILLLCAILMQSGVFVAAQDDSSGASDTASVHELDIRPIGASEQGVSTEDARVVMLSAASQIWRYFDADALLAPMEVKLQGGPIALYERGPNDEYRVRLDIEGRRWNQLAYQFAHEFCHILCRYDRREHPNKWFEESLCEAASIFALLGMAEEWETDPPYEHWSDYSEFLQSYAEERIERGRINVDSVEPDSRDAFVDWFDANRAALSESATDRDRNSVVAVRLLRLLKESPEDWASVTYLNVEPDLDDASFEEYLSAWRRHCPEERRAFVDRVAEEYGVEAAQ
jgi:hypothetical protein